MLSVLWSKKSKAILEFRKCLPRELTAEYNLKERYTKEEVTFIIATKHPKYIGYLAYAFAMFLWEEDLIAYNKSIGELYSLSEIVADIKFNIKEESDQTAFAKNSSVSSATSLR